jgi:uncharacterized protein DUF3558
MASMTRGTIALLAAVLLAVAGCTNDSAGSPLPTGSPEGGQTVSSRPPTSSDNVAAKLAAIDPCSLLTQAELDQYGLQRRHAGDLAGSRHCSWGHLPDENGEGGFVVGAAIWDRQGLKDINESGYSVTDAAIGKRQARQAAQNGGNGCFVAIGVSDSSRVDVTASGDPGQGCVLANRFAELIEPRLPGRG